MTRSLRNLVSGPAAGMFLFLILASVAMSFVSPFFLTWLNWANILNQSALLVLVAMGMTIVLIAGGIDLSVGAIAALAGGVAAWLISTAGVPLPLALLAGCLTGLALGVVNGLVITLMRIPDFVATLAMLALIRGVLFVLTQGVPIVSFSSPAYSMLGGLTRLPFSLTVPEFMTAAVLILGVP
ncbi:MAG: ribose ABC transporter permease, partial [Rhodobacter sp. CACIA14H1]